MRKADWRKGEIYDTAVLFSLQLEMFRNTAYDEAESEESNIVPIQIVKEKVEERKIMGDQKKKIFFGSSKEAADTMDIIAALVSSLGYDTVTWNSPNASVFIAGDNTIDSLLNVADKVDGAVFIFDEDDKIWYRDGIEGTVRDNVIFEYGLFMGKLGKQKVVIANKKKPKLATDLKGITYIDANKGEAEVKLQLKEWLIHKIENN